MESKGECGECPVCGGPTRKAEGEPFEPGEEGQEMEICWNQCYYHLDNYGEHLLRVGDRAWWWGWHDASPRQSDRPSEEIDGAIEELKAQRRSRYKEPEAQRFLAALDRGRFDKTTRMVFADWLEEHGYDDEAVFQRSWTREWQEARDHLLLCAADCRITYDELLEAATAHLGGKEGDDEATLLLGHDPDIVYDTETFWRAYQTVTGRETGGDRGGFFSCAC
jgi:uncharacterized protein (TIGR02996 family)